MKKRILLMFGLVSVSPLCSSSQGGRPSWVDERPEGYTHDFFVGKGESKASEVESREQSLLNAIRAIVQSGRITVEASQGMNSSATEIFKNGESTSLDVISKIVTEVQVKGESQTIHGLREEEQYHEFDGEKHTSWTLVKLPKNIPRHENPPTRFDAIWRSALLPGWGQIYKGQKAKGFIIMGSEALLIPGAIILNNLKINAQSDAYASNTQALRDYYTDRANLYQNLSLAAYIIAGALYVYNVVDAIAAEGDKIYVDRNRSLDTPPLCLGFDGAVLSIRIRL